MAYECHWYVGLYETETETVGIHAINWKIWTLTNSDTQLSKSMQQSNC